MRKHSCMSDFFLHVVNWEHFVYSYVLKKTIVRELSVREESMGIQ